MKIIKESQGGQSVAVTEQDMELINRLSRKKLGREEVYTFAVRLCDNEIDRDNERFPAQTLEQLAKLFVGRSGIFDHAWTAAGQTARIYRTEVVREKGQLTRAGDGLCYLKGYAYMVRTKANEDLIAEIEGGIKKEVSVGCAVARAVCSICGAKLGECVHEKGQEYGGKLCWAELEEATDAYEFSFVAVPAQRQAGVMKSRGMVYTKLSQLVMGHPRCAEELARLEKEAQAGRSYLSGLRREVVRLGALAESGLDTAVLQSITDKLEERELLELKQAFEGRTGARYAQEPQLSYAREEKKTSGNDGAFLI